jgi:hypothetical protein
MASAAVVDHLHLEALPLIDLRLLSQSELYSLSLFSSSSYSSNDNDDVLTPKIDRSVFNESAGSRKQTYSRLRLAPRKPQCTSTASPTRIRTPTPFPSTPRQIPEPLDEENPQIISLLKQLFAAQASTAENPATADDDDKLVSVRVEFEEALPDWWSAGFQDVPIDVVPGTAGDGGGEQKRKRGRPRKSENWRIEPRTEHKAEPNVPVDVVVSEGETKRKRGRPRKEENPMIERRQNENWRIEPRTEHKAEPNVPVDVVVSEGEKKRKRGRPRKEQNPMIERRQSEREMAVAEEKEVVMVNKKGDVADVAALANVKDPYGEELKRRTEGLQTEAELLEFLSVLPGESMNRSRKRRIVLASDFGDVLPEGWKIMLTVKKRASRVWLHCRRYIRFL